MNGFGGWLALVIAFGATAGFLFGFARRLLFRYLREPTTRVPIPPPTAPTDATENEHAGEIHIYRQPAYADRLRAYTVLLDGEAVGAVLAGATCTVIAPEGKHIIKLTIDWCESNPITVEALPGFPQRLTVSSSLRGSRLALGLWYVAFARKSYLSLKYSEAAP
jgi:hypothetical protein